MKTPSKTSTKPWEIDPYESPSAVRDLFTPSKKTAIGPTPQKDGQVLGLFDLLEEHVTPVKAGEALAIKGSIQATPRKLTSAPTSTHKHSRTPASTGKRFMLDMFATPLKSLHPNDQGGKTPSSVSKLHFSTPSFLRRDNQRTQMPVLNENESFNLSPPMVRIPRKPLARGLSSMLAGLRKMEEEAADEDLEALHEMEKEMAAVSQPVPKTSIPTVVEAVLLEDNQPRLPLGGFDDEAKYDSEPEDLKNPTLGRDGQPLKIYKKKGQKRTTRRVNLKPTRTKLQSHSESRAQEDSDDDLAQLEEAVPETQVDETTGFADTRNFDSDSQSEYTASEGGTRYRRPDQRKEKRIGKDGRIRTAARKVTAVAHQNFKRLKLRNSGAKGGPGHGSRFRRKR